MHLFIDGVLVQTSVGHATFNNDIDQVTIGNEAGQQWGFIGILDEIRIYNRALNTTEIDSLYHQGGWPLNQQNTAPFNLETFEGTVPAGGSIVTIDTTKYLKIRLNGWNTEFPISPIIINAPSTLSFTYKYDKDTSTYIGAVRAFVQFFDTTHHNISIVDDPISNALKNLAFNLSTDTLASIQLAAQTETGGWPALAGPILYISQMKLALKQQTNTGKAKIPCPRCKF